MTLSEAKSLCEELRGRFDAPYSTLDKHNIELLYRGVLGKQFVVTTCQQCYHDAVIEIYLYLKRNNRMKEKCDYEMRKGFIIKCPTFHDGQIFTNNNLTNEIAAEYLELFPEKAVLFAVIPPKVVDDTTTKAKAKKPRRTKKTKE